MSKFSGKCDLYDSLSTRKYTDEQLQNEVLIYVGDSDESLHIETSKDLIPYYPHIISMSWHNGEKAVMRLTSESFVDISEREILEWRLKGLLRIYNRCKRKHIEFEVEKAVDELCWLDHDRDKITELANRVKEHGKKAKVDGIHLVVKDWYRKELVNEMVANGLNPVEYGYERFICQATTAGDERS